MYCHETVLLPHLDNCEAPHELTINHILLNTSISGPKATVQCVGQLLHSLHISILFLWITFHVLCFVIVVLCCNQR